MTDSIQQEQQAPGAEAVEAAPGAGAKPVNASRPGADIFPRLSSQDPIDANQHTASSSDIEMILDIPVVLTVELGRTRMPIGQILQLAHGSVIELDALAGEPMDVLVNGCLIAQGEVVVVNDRFGIRLTDTVTPAERMRRLHRAR